MKISYYLIAAWLIAMSSQKLLSWEFQGDHVALAILAAMAGIMIFVEQGGIRFKNNLGMALLAIWLLASALSAIIQLSFIYQDKILAAIALSSGIALLIRR